jgi:hypothetical protein
VKTTEICPPIGGDRRVRFDMADPCGQGGAILHQVGGMGLPSDAGVAAPGSLERCGVTRREVEVLERWASG